ncbi:MAG: DMT family transporter [Chloroflexi bacterium]|nr:DMT family transporter [Chloroflexota bacterium]
MPHLLLFVVVLIWSGNTVISKMVVAEVPPAQLALVRFSLGVLAFHVPFFLVLYRRAPRFRRDEWVRLAGIGAGGAGTSVLCFTIGLSYAPATYTSLISMIGPPLTALMAWVLLREKLTTIRAIGTGIAFFGAALLVSGGSLAAPPPELLTGAVFLVLSQGTWAIYILFGKPILAYRQPALIMGASHLFALCSMWPISLFTGGWNFLWDAQQWSPGVWLGICYLAFANTALSQLLFLLALRDVSAAQAVSYTYLQPPLTAVMAMFALDEQPTVMTFVCGAIILIGLWLVNRPQPSRAARPAREPRPAVSVRPVKQ